MSFQNLLVLFIMIQHKFIIIVHSIGNIIKKEIIKRLLYVTDIPIHIFITIFLTINIIHQQEVDYYQIITHFH